MRHEGGKPFGNNARLRKIDPAFATAGQTVNFADGFPVLLGSLGSLSDLNTRSRCRFRLAASAPISS
jgi:uncharacterized protein YcbX